MGSVGAAQGALSRMREEREREQSVPTYEEVRAIQNSNYPINNISSLTQSQRDRLAEIVYNGIISSGPTATNSMYVVNAINTQSVVTLNLANFDSNDLAEIKAMNITKDISDAADVLIRYYTA